MNGPRERTTPYTTPWSTDSPGTQPVSTLLFVVSYLPMLVKAFRTRDLESYSLGNLVLANVGNAVHSIYVFSLPPGTDLVPARVLRGVHRADAGVAPSVRPSEANRAEAGAAS